MAIDSGRALRLLAELRDIDLASRSRKAVSLAEKQRRQAIARELNQIALDGQSAPGGQNQRAHARAQVKLRVQLLGGPRAATELTTDSLAVGGVSVAISFTPRVSDFLPLKFIPAPPDDPFEVMGEVVWFHPVRMRAGLRFHDLSDEGRAVIERVIYADLFRPRE